MENNLLLAISARSHVSYYLGFMLILFASIAHCQEPGDVLWSHSLGSSLHALTQTSNGDMYVVGWVNAPDQSSLVAKTSAQGAVDWSWTSTPDWVWGDSFNDVYAKPEGGCLVSGTSESSYYSSRSWIASFSDTGSLEWSNKFTVGVYSGSQALAVQETGNIFLVGQAQQETSFSEGVMVELTPTGSVIQEYWLGTQLNNATDICFSPEANPVLAGSYGSQAKIVKLDSNGSFLWSFTYQDTLRSSIFNSIVGCADGGYVAAGDVHESSSQKEILLVRLDSTGDSLWTRKYSFGQYNLGRNIVCTSNGYLLSGVGDHMMLTMRLDSLGEIGWMQNSSGGSIQQSIIQSDSTCISVGQGYSPGEYFGGILHALRYDYSTFIVSSENNAPSSTALQPTYPNPFNSVTRIPITLLSPENTRLSMYDILGREVCNLVNGQLPAGTTTIPLEASGFPSGIYILRLERQNSCESRKLILVK